jgi:hypothetical protein
VDFFRFVLGYRDVIFDQGKEPPFLLLVAFVIAFACARGYAQVAHKRGWGSGSVRVRGFKMRVRRTAQPLLRPHR